MSLFKLSLFTLMFFLIVGVIFYIYVSRKKNIPRDDNIWMWFNEDGTLKFELVDDIGETHQFFDNRLCGNEIPSPKSCGNFWISSSEARFRHSQQKWYLVYNNPQTKEAILKYTPQQHEMAQRYWEEKQSKENQDKIISADLSGRLPLEGELYKGLGLYICRNVMETYSPGFTYVLTLTSDGMFENFSCLPPHSQEKNQPNQTRFKNLPEGLEALACLMENHGNLNHAQEFREAIKDLPIDE